jgi:hypothetical protein
VFPFLSLCLKIIGLSIPVLNCFFTLAFLILSTPDKPCPISELFISVPFATFCIFDVCSAFVNTVIRIFVA